MVWDKMKGMLFEEEPNSTTTAPAKPAAAPVQGGQAPSTMSNFSAPTLNEAMVGAIRKATFSRNTALTNLITQAENFADVIPDPTMQTSVSIARRISVRSA